MNLYPYQQQLKSFIYKNWHLKKNVLACAPPRSGKTVVFSSIAADVQRKGKRILILTDREELQRQIGGTLDAFLVDYHYIKGGAKRYDTDASCFVAMSQTLKNRVGVWNEFFSSIDVLLIDECHQQDFNYVFSAVRPDCLICGFTGTPARSGKMRQLGLDYEILEQEVKPSALLKLHRIVPADIYTYTPPDLTGVAYNSATGDYNTAQLFGKFNKKIKYETVVREFTNICPDATTMVYCVNRMHALKTCQAFVDAGYNFRYVISDMGKPRVPGADTEASRITYEKKIKEWELFNSTFERLSGDRRQLFDDFHRGKLQGLVNVDIATKGYDCPRMTAVILNYSTASLTRYLQSSMRGGTALHGKESYSLLDFGGNIAKFGDPLNDRIYGLWHEEQKGGGVAPIKFCGRDKNGEMITNKGKQGCSRPIAVSLNMCPFCGFEYPEKSMIDAFLEQQAYDFEQQKMVKTKLIKDMNFKELHDYWKMKGHRTAWLWRKLWARGGRKAIETFGRQYGWSYGTIEKAVGFCMASHGRHTY